MFDLTGKVALITGASGGIGGSIALMFKACGAKVVLSGTKKLALDQMVADMKNEVLSFPADLSQPNEGRLLVEKVIEQLGSLDILVNNAGVTRDNLAVRMKSEDWKFVLDINLGATFELSQACIRKMMKARWGRIINITSVVGVTGNAGQTNYAASKAGIIGMSKSLAQEVASRGITVNCIAPGFIQTPMTAALSNSQSISLIEKIPVGRMGDPAEVASAAVYLASTQAAYITGHTLHVNGGLAMI